MKSSHGMVAIAERIKKVMGEKLKQDAVKKKSGLSGDLNKCVRRSQPILMSQELSNNKFPMILEREVEEFNRKQREKSKNLFERNSMIDDNRDFIKSGIF